MRAAARTRLLRLAAALWLLALALAAQAPARITRPVDLGQTVRLRGNTPVQLRAAVDRGAAPPDLALAHMLLVLRRSRAQQAALDRYLDELREQDSGRYHAWLTPSQFGERFGPAASDIAKVTSWLSGAGFRVERVAAGRGVIEFSGTAGTVAAALHTTVHRYLVNGRLHWANAGDPAIPAALAPVVAGVVSLNDFRARPMRRRSELAPAAAPPPITPEFNIPSSTGGSVQHAIVPGDLATIYDLAGAQKNYSGAGETIAIVANTEISTTDFDQFRSIVMSAPANVLTTISADGTQGNQNDTPDQGEATLDAEWAGAAAPAAKLDQVVASDTVSSGGIDLSAEYIVDHDLAPIVTISYGYCEAQIGAAGSAFWNSLWQQAAAEGITVLVAAGDTGAAACDSLSGTPATSPPGVNAIASTPYDTAVGGTEFNDAANPGAYWSSGTFFTASALGYIPETAWSEDDPAGNGQPEQWLAGGGGPSAIYAKPPWQSAAGVPADGFRDLPDVALTAATHDGYVMCFQGSCALSNANGAGFQFFLVAGTSASTPAMAGIVALVDQAMGGRQGLINPVLYRLAAAPGVFHDITSGANDVPCQFGSSPQCVNGELGYSATPGYDLATGLGSVDGTNLVNQWGSVTFAKSTTTLQLGVASPQNLTVDESVPVTVQVAGAGAGAPPTGTVELLAQTPAGATSVIATLSLDPSGDASATTALPAGSYNLVASYSGDNTYGASASAAVAVTVAKSTPTVQIGFYALNAQGQPQPVTEVTYATPVYAQVAVLLPGGLTPTGTVTLTEASGTSAGPFGTYQLAANGAVVTPSYAYNPGAYTVTAVYSGDANFLPATSAGVSLTVDNLANTLQITGYTDTTVTILQDIAVGYSVTAANLLCSGPVEISADGVGIGSANGGTAAASANGDLQCSRVFHFSAALPGTVTTLTAEDSGHVGLLPSTSAPVTIPTPPNLTLSTSSMDFGIVPGGTSKSESATLVNAGGQTASHLVFSGLGWGYTEADNCGGVLAAGASCTVTITFTSTAPTNGLVVFVYIDDGTLPGPSASLTALVPSFAFAAPSSGGAMAVTAGQTAQLTLTLTPANGFQGPVSLSCVNPPPLASCSFAPATPVLAGGAVSVILSIATTARPASLRVPGALPPRGQGRPGWPAWGWLAVLAGLTAVALRRGRRLPAAILLGAIALSACGGGSIPGAAGTAGGAASDISVSPASLSFGTDIVNSASAPQYVEIRNTSATAYFPPSVVVASGPFLVHSSCGELAPQASCSAAVSFLPTAAGTASGSLAVQDAFGHPVMVALSGTGQYAGTPQGVYATMVQGVGGGVSSSFPLTVTVH